MCNHLILFRKIMKLLDPPWLLFFAICKRLGKSSIAHAWDEACARFKDQEMQVNEESLLGTTLSSMQDISFDKTLLCFSGPCKILTPG